MFTVSQTASPSWSHHWKVTIKLCINATLEVFYQEIDLHPSTVMEYRHVTAFAPRTIKFNTVPPMVVSEDLSTLFVIGSVYRLEVGNLHFTLYCIRIQHFYRELQQNRPSLMIRSRPRPTAALVFRPTADTLLLGRAGMANSTGHIITVRPTTATHPFGSLIQKLLTMSQYGRYCFERMSVLSIYKCICPRSILAFRLLLGQHQP